MNRNTNTFASSAFALMALLTCCGTSSAAPRAPSLMGVCDTAQVIAGPEAMFPTVVSSFTHNTTFVYFNRDRLLAGDGRIHVANFGPDGRPGTNDDSTIQLTTGATGTSDYAPSSDGRYVAFTRSNGSSMSTMLYDLGADLLPGTMDDVTETTIATYPITSTGMSLIETSVYDGLVGWVVNSPNTPGQTQLAMCDARKPVGQPGGCLSTITPIRLPHLTTASSLMMYRDLSSGTELQVGFVRTLTRSGLFSFTQGSFAFESNLGIAIPWPGNVAVTVLGIFSGILPVIGDSTSRNPHLGSLLAPNSGPALSLPFNAPEFGVAGIGNNPAPSSGAQAVIWQSEFEMLYQPMLTSSVKQIKFPLIDSNASAAPQAISIDGAVVAFEHTEIVPPNQTIPYTHIERHGLRAVYCD